MRLRHVVQLQGHGRPEIEQARAEARALRNRGRGADRSMGWEALSTLGSPSLFGYVGRRLSLQLFGETEGVDSEEYQ